ncbi:hypothetical protein CDL15_Pgr007945 [Punica granatum]|uniref:DC1 domain-containing protein n=1 Tax=Punica granatum TaxID=22663 RepID=A0A218XB26_PUNGR|nr:hypothetical protein CDL15_Pgr007945 [Punica granatum]
METKSSILTRTRPLDSAVACVCNEKDRQTFVFFCMVPTSGYAVHVHFACAPLSFPETVKHLYHHHRLVLIKPKADRDDREDNPEPEFEGEYDSDEYYYCGVRAEKELRRNAGNPVYYCKECEFSAHVGCSIAKVRRAFVLGI